MEKADESTEQAAQRHRVLLWICKILDEILCNLL